MTLFFSLWNSVNDCHLRHTIIDSCNHQNPSGETNVMMSNTQHLLQKFQIVGHPPTNQNRQPSINIFTTWVPNKSSNCSTDSWIVILCHPSTEMSRFRTICNFATKHAREVKKCKEPLAVRVGVFRKQQQMADVFWYLVFSLENRSRRKNLLQLPPRTCMKQQFSDGALQWWESQQTSQPALLHEPH